MDTLDGYRGRQACYRIFVVVDDDDGCLVSAVALLRCVQFLDNEYFTR